MILNSIVSKICYRQKPRLFKSRCLFKKSHDMIFLHIMKLSDSSALIPEKSEKISQRKLLKVAILGRPNAGKSTLINRILNMNICDVSCKTHTTRIPLRAAFVFGDTQIVFVDTPGIVTKKEYSRFSLTKTFLNWKDNIFKEVDVLGVVYDASLMEYGLKLHHGLTESLNEKPNSIPAFLILNKMDLVKNKTVLLEVTEKLIHSKDSEDSVKFKNWKMFSNIFFVSALKNNGVKDIVDYLLSQAKPSDWLLESGQVCDTPLHVLIINLIRAKMLNILPEEVPYQCKYEIEFLEENNLSQIVCVALITCKYRKHVHMIIGRRKNQLRELTQAIESDLYNALGKTIKLRIVVISGR